MTIVKLTATTMNTTTTTLPSIDTLVVDTPNNNASVSSGTAIASDIHLAPTSRASSTSFNLRASKKIINVRRLNALPSQLKLESDVRQELLSHIAARSTTPAPSTSSAHLNSPPSPSRTSRTRSITAPSALPSTDTSTPAFDFIDFQRHDPAFRDAWLLDHRFRKDDLLRRENKWRTVDRHSGASTQLVVFQCKCGIPPKVSGAAVAPGGASTGKQMGGVRTYPYLRCKAFVHMTCDSDGLALVVRGFFTHSPACADSSTLSPPRLVIDPTFEQQALSQLKLNQPMRVILEENARLVRELGEDRLREIREKGTRALLCRSDVRNLRRALLRKRPDLKKVHTIGDVGRKRDGGVAGGKVRKSKMGDKKKGRKGVRKYSADEDEEEEEGGNEVMDEDDEEDDDSSAESGRSTSSSSPSEALSTFITPSILPSIFRVQSKSDDILISDQHLQSSTVTQTSPMNPITEHLNPAALGVLSSSKAGVLACPTPSFFIPRNLPSDHFERSGDQLAVTAKPPIESSPHYQPYGYPRPQHHTWYPAYYYNTYAPPHRRHEWHVTSSTYCQVPPYYTHQRYRTYPQEQLRQPEGREEAVNVKNWKEVVMVNGRSAPLGHE